MLALAGAGDTPPNGLYFSADRPLGLREDAPPEQVE